MPVLSKIRPVKCWDFANRRRFPVRFPRFTVIVPDFQRNNTQGGDSPIPERDNKSWKNKPVVSLLSVVAFLVTLEDCVHPISESIQCEDWLKWGIFVPTHLAPTTINVQGKVPLA